MATGAAVPLRRAGLLALFTALLIERMLDLELGVVRGLSLKNAGIYSLLGLLLLGALLRGRILLSAPPRMVNIAFAVLIFYAGVSWYFAPQLNPWSLPYERAEGLAALKGLLDQYMLFLVFLLMARSRADGRWVVRGILGLVAMSNVVTLIDVYDLVDLGIIHERADGRVSGPMGESNQFGAFMVLFLPNLLAMPLLSRGFARFFWTVGALASATALLLSVSRGALSGVLVGGVLGTAYLLRYIPRRQLFHGTLLILAVAVVVVSIVMLEYRELLYERLLAQSRVEDIGAVSSGRSQIWAAALSALSAHPATYLVGGGWNMYENMRLLGMYFFATHNTYLSYLYDLGVVGLACYLLVVAGVLRCAKGGIAARAPHERVELIAFVIGFLSLLWAIFFVNLYDPWLLIWCYIGAMMRLAVAGASEEPARTPAAATLIKVHPG